MKLPDKSLSWVTRHGRTRSLIRCQRAPRRRVTPVELSDAPRKIVANLPYNIATPLLIGWLDRIGEYDSLTLMFQREVAERLAAAPRSKSYGRLSVLVQWLADPQILFDIPPRAFVGSCQCQETHRP
jgi:16S rRNA (adenine1518-N6/adenine1519-N6)-dimethyltransferase